jgi:ABC-type bacteriocin/lantibiotic exporter with double-glycine peptidase domain
MVLTYWGIEREQALIARQLGLIHGAGVPGNRIRKLASKRLAVFYGAGDLTDMQMNLDQGVPPIVLVHTGELPHWKQSTAHAVVLLGIDSQAVYLNDPAIAQDKIRVSIGDFELAWDEMANLYASIRTS